MPAVLIIAGPSAVGKTTVASLLLKAEPKFRFIRSATTRSPRGDGNDGEYIYLDREEFLSQVEHGKMLEYTEYGENLYGTPNSEIERIHGEGNIPLLILDINGVVSLKSTERDFGIFSVYIYDELNVMERRLYDRELANSPSAEALCRFVKRKEANIRDYLHLPETLHCFDALIKNDSPQNAAQRILDAFLGKDTDSEARDREQMKIIVEDLKHSAEEKINNN